MSKINDGGPAFPQSGGVEQLESPLPLQGMTLRDYFAAKAMETFLQGAVLPPEFDAEYALSLVAGRAYEVADAMLRAREVQS